MKKNRYMKKILLINIFSSILFCQNNIDVLIQQVLGGVKDSAIIYLPKIESQYPNNPKMLFLKGLLETNGNKAMQTFVDLYNSHPTSNYGDDAVMKVAEFYYASGLYVKSAEWLKKMPLFYSRSEHIERALKLFLNSLIVSGHKDTAIFYSKVFQKQFPTLDVDGKISNLLRDYENSNLSSEIHIEKTIVNEQKKSSDLTKSSNSKKKLNNNLKNYSLQSGAFSLRKNAENQMIFLKGGGFNSRIIELDRKSKKLYVVRIGNYQTKQEADKIASTIKSTLDISTIIITNK